jgi:hypothetical protein
MKRWSLCLRIAVGTLQCLILTAILSLSSARAEIFKWIDENEVVHYTANRASIPIKFQDTVKIVEPPSSPTLFRSRRVPVPETAPGADLGGVEEEALPPERPGEAPVRKGDVVGGVLSSANRPSAAPEASSGQPLRTARTTPLALQGYAAKGEGWWRAQFIQSQDAVEKQQGIVNVHRQSLRKIIKSHASGNEVIPLEDDPEFQKMAHVLPREESRLNQLKRKLRRLEARANDLRIPESWRR